MSVQREYWAEIHRLEHQISGVNQRLAGFDLAILLLTAAVDAKACAARLAELREATAAAEKAQSDLAAAREAHSREVSEANRDLDRRKSAIAEDAATVRSQREALSLRFGSRADDAFPINPNLLPGTRSRGLARAR
jgi:predicted  nucleic acid-binding Zn-ribbon protein